jgi:hypothetical protein
MRFWWVNHKGTHAEEIGRGYISSPSGCSTVSGSFADDGTLLTAGPSINKRLLQWRLKPDVKTPALRPKQLPTWHTTGSAWRKKLPRACGSSPGRGSV